MKAFLATAALLVFAACSGSGTTQPTPTAAGSNPPAAAGVECGGAGGPQVAVADFAFNPQSSTAIVDGTTTWTNADSATHTITFNDGPDCGRIANGESVTATFSGPGTYAYHCSIHASMKGTVVVE